MDFNDYQIKAYKLANYGTGKKIIYPTLGLCGEAGEVSDKVKKALRDANGEFSKEIKDSLLLELGDVLWYLSAISNDLGIKLSDVAEMNLKKLHSRTKRNKINGSGDYR